MIVSSIVAALSAQAQTLPIPSLSPRAKVMQEIGVVEARVDYARPAKRDRVIWGELVPFGELWRTGANRATTLELSGTVSIAGTEVEAGRYAIFTRPGENSWTVIINGNPDQGGTGSYDESLDVVRFEAEPADGPGMERLTFLFDDVTDTSADLELMWDGVQITIPIEVDSGKMLDDAVDGYVGRSARGLAQAARHYSRQGRHEQASATADEALEISEDWYTAWTKAEVTKAANDTRKARWWAKRAKRYADDAKEDGQSVPDFYADRIEAAVDDWR